MNCRDCRDWLQRRLDARRLEPVDEVAEHLAECERCRGDVAAARVLLDGLESLPRVPPTRLRTASIAAAVAADRRRLRRRSKQRWLAGSLAGSLVAASFAAAAWIGLFRGPSPSPPSPAPQSPVPQDIAAAPEPSPQPPKEQAKDAAPPETDAPGSMAALTRTVAEKTRLQFNELLPKAALDVRLRLPQFEPGFDPGSLTAAGRSMAQAFHPVTDTTRQAFGFLARELPLRDVAKN